MPRRASPVRLCKSVSRSGRSMPASSRADRGQAVRRRRLLERARGRPPPARLRDHERDHGRQHPGRTRRQPVRGQGQARQVERGAGPDRALDRREPLPGDRQPRRGARDARAQGGRRGGVPTEPEAGGKPPVARIGRRPASTGLSEPVQPEITSNRCSALRMDDRTSIGTAIRTAGHRPQTRGHGRFRRRPTLPRPPGRWRRSRRTRGDCVRGCAPGRRRRPRTRAGTTRAWCARARCRWRR